MSKFVFIDSRVQNIEGLLAGLSADVQVVVLDPAQDGMARIAEALAGVTDLDSIHLVSHGSSGTLFLGSTVLTREILGDYQDELSRIGAALSADGDILLYGCDVAAGDAGRAYIESLALLTGADVAASIDATGSATLGGDWVLESSTGAIEADIVVPDAAQQEYLSLLAGEPTAVGQLNGANGFKLDGVATSDISGWSVSNAGDVNGDGYDDVIVGAPGADPNGATSGASYVVFGKLSGFSANIVLSTLDGSTSTGFKINGVAAGDNTGHSVSSAGDVNGDGYGDLFIGATGAGSASGSGYVVFGGSAATLDALHGTSGFNLSSLGGATGFRLNGAAAGDIAGYSVSSAGDVNGDGFDDLIIGAPYHNYGSPGASYVVFGKASGFSTVALSALDGSTGFRLLGATTYGYYSGTLGDRSGWSVSGAGDVNGDGFDDLVVGAPKNRSSVYATPWGASYVVFGKASGFASTVDLSALNGGASGGFKISSTSLFDYSSGRSVSGAGDVNGDGYDDLIIGAPYADPHGSGIPNIGSSYVVFGMAGGFLNISVSTINGFNGTGFSIHGAAANDQSGSAVSNAGDINGDGFDDLLIGARGVNAPYSDSGATYVVFGKANWLNGYYYSSEPVELSNLSTAAGTGFRIAGDFSGDQSGRSVSAAGDINGDGFDDLIVGAPYVGSHRFYYSDLPLDRGASYVVFGGNFTSSVNYLDTSADNTTFTGGAGADVFVSAQGNDTINGGGNADVIRAGAGDDRIVVSDTNFADVDGGSGIDTLALTNNTNLNLTTFANNRISGIEVIDLASGNHALTLAVLDLYDLSDSSNKLTVDGDANDQVAIEGAVTRAKITTGAYDTYVQGTSQAGAKLVVDSDIPITFLNSSDNLNELLVGTGGNDTITGAGGNDTLDGNGGVDRASYAGAGSPVSVSLAIVIAQNTVGAGTDTLINIDDLEGSGGNDTLAGDGNANRLVGLVGNDILTGGLGNDTLDGTTGTDRASYAAAGSPVTVSLALSGGGQNTVGAGTDTLLNIDELEGSGGNDTLTGDGNTNRLIGLLGNDILNGGLGTDTLDGTSGTDRASYADAGSPVTVSLALSGGGQNTGGAGTDTLLNIDELEGSGHDDTLTGDGNPNRLVGLLGNDILNGGLGNDTLDGTTGTDRASYADAGSPVTVSLAILTAQNTGGAGTDTLLNIDELEGSGGNDTLTGDGFTSRLIGLAGNDILIGGLGSDTLEGGLDADTLIGGAGDDTLDGGTTGTDRASYADAGSPVTVSLAIAGAQNTIGAGTDTLLNIDDLEGSGHNDTLTGDDGANRLVGLAGNDTLVGGLGDDTLDGTTGIDRASYAAADSPVTVSLAIVTAQNTVGAGTDTLLNIDELEGSAYKDTLTGDANANRLFGLVEDDTLDGGAGDDTLIGGDGNDDYYVDSALDVVEEPVNGEIDFVFASVTYTLSNDINTGYADHLTLTGSDDIDGTGNDQFNKITGNSGANRLDGGGNHGDDEMAGRGGNDTYVVDAATDVVREVFNEGDADIVEASVSYALPDSSTTYYVENLLLTGGENIDATGNQLNNAITGNSANNHLIGLDGDDMLDGAAGDDWLEGRVGLDTLIGGAGDDSLAGGAAADTLIGGAGNDTLNGGLGADSMLGGGDDDTYIVDNVGDEVVEYLNEGSDVVRSALTWTLGANVEDLFLTGADSIDGTGNSLSNQLFGNNASNRLVGGDGDDQLKGWDVVSPDTGADTLEGGLGNDLYYVDSTTDKIIENPGEGSADIVYTSVGITLPANVEQVTIVDALALFIAGNGLNNLFTGSNGADSLDGAGGDDTLNGGLGADSMVGGFGSDTYYVDNAGDVVVETSNIAGGLMLPGGGGGGFKPGLLGGVLDNITDTVIAAINFSLSGLTYFERLVLINSATQATGNTLANELEGNAQFNQLFGMEGNDTLDGAGGDDTLDGGPGSDTVSFATLTTGVLAGLASGTAVNGLAVDTLIAVENLSGSAYNDTLAGNAGANALAGGLGNDTLDGGAGMDSLVGGDGDDSYYTGVTAAAGASSIVFLPDAIVEAVNQGSDTVYSNASFTLAAQTDNLVLTGAPSWRPYSGTGNDLNNAITGQGNVRHILDGGGGADTLNAGDGNDVLIWDPADALVDGGAGTDTLRLAPGANLNLTTIADGVIQNVEMVDLLAAGAHTLTLALSDVLALSSTTETLRIEGDASDVVDGSGWIMGSTAAGYTTWTQGGAILIVDADITQSGLI